MKTSPRFSPSGPSSSGRTPSPTARALSVGDPRILLPLCALGAAAWLIGLRNVDLARLGDVGFVSMLPPWSLLGLALLTAAICISITANTPTWVRLVLMVTVTIVLYGLTAMVETEARFAPLWRHIGLTDYIVRRGAVDASLDAYFSWPGLFSTLAFLVKLAGLGNAGQLLQLANWSPMFFNLLYAGVLASLYLSLSRDRRVMWLAIWLFLISNWAGQDYMSPQALAYFLYLVAVTIVVRWFQSTRPWPPWVRRLASSAANEPPTSVRTRRLLLLCLLVICAAIVVSHPLTPLFLVSGLVFLVVLGGVRPWWLPLSMMILLGIWDGVMTRDSLAAQLYATSDVSSGLLSKIGQNVSGRAVGSQGHQLVVTMREATTAALFGLAGLGVWRSIKAHSAPVAALLLMVAPVPLLLVGAYGGEMLIRIQLFSLPFVCFFAAKLFYPALQSAESTFKTVALLLVSLALVGSFLFTRYGNERGDYISSQEVQATNHLYAIATPGSLLVWDGAGPAKYQYIERYNNDSISEKDIAGSVTKFESRLRSRRAQTFVIITRSGKAYVDMSSDLPPGALDRFESALVASRDFRVVYVNPDAAILQLDTGSRGR